MAHSPATSDKGGAQIMAMICPAVPSPEHFTPVARIKQVTSLDPSPASTNGESATDGSNPATPQDVHVRDLASSMYELSMNEVNGSPKSTLVHGSTCLMLGDNVAQGSATTSSPSGSVKNGNARDSSSVDSSPATHRSGALKKSPAQSSARNNSFVRSSGANDDPFVTGSSTASVPSAEPAVPTYPIRPDRVGNLPTPGTAQAHFHPDACIFVANLLQTASDVQLEHEVTLAFSQFGMTETEAQHAVTEGRNIPILGRQCRTEIARVNRTLYLSKIVGGDVTRTEARNALRGYGAIEELHYPSSAERALYGLPQGIFVRFHFYDDCRDAQIKFRIHDGYRLEQARVPEDLRAPRHHGPAPGTGFANTTSPRGYPCSPTSEPVRFDDRSIFIGNLPGPISGECIREHFAQFGRIVGMDLRRKQSSIDPAVTTAYCFIEYSTRGEAEAAIRNASRRYDGRQLRVEQRVSRRPPMSQAGSPTGSNQMSNGQWPAQQDMLMMLYQRGIEMGLQQASQAAAVSPPVILPPIFTSYQQSYYPQYDNAMGVYGGHNGAPPTYALGPPTQGNPILVPPMVASQYMQAAAPAQHGQSEQAHDYTASATPRHVETPYVWPMSNGDIGASSSPTSH